ncbi:MAG: hypothetical protein AAF368_09315, partial [Planctomycetota bacterium]
MASAFGQGPGPLLAGQRTPGIPAMTEANLDNHLPSSEPFDPSMDFPSADVEYIYDFDGDEEDEDRDEDDEDEREEIDDGPQFRDDDEDE